MELKQAFPYDQRWLKVNVGACHCGVCAQSCSSFSPSPPNDAFSDAPTTAPFLLVVCCLLCCFERVASITETADLQHAILHGDVELTKNHLIKGTTNVTKPSQHHNATGEPEMLLPAYIAVPKFLALPLLLVRTYF